MKRAEIKPCPVHFPAWGKMSWSRQFVISALYGGMPEVVVDSRHIWVTKADVNLGWGKAWGVAVPCLIPGVPLTT